MKFKLDGYTFDAEKCVDGILFNPKLPKNFDDTDNQMRPASHHKWWYRPFIITGSVEDLDKFYAERDDDYTQEYPEKWSEVQKQWVDEGRNKWLEHYPTGIQYIVRCLDGGAWDRSTNYGMLGDFDVAMAQANGLKRV
jgi:hypothetical protein